MEEVRLIDANALHKRIEMNLHASNPFTIEECCYKDALNSVDEAPTCLLYTSPSPRDS